MHRRTRCGVVLAAAMVASCSGGGGSKATPEPATTSTVASAPTTGATVSVGATTTSVAQPGEPPGDFVKRLFRYIDNGQFDREWDELDPRQQVIVPKDLYMRCSSESLSGTGIPKVQVLETYAERVGIPGTKLRDLESTAVTVQLTVTRAGEKTTEKDTFHVLSVDGRWRWVISDPIPYKNGQCPA